MNYLVLGAGGYIGSYLYRRLREDGQNVWGTTRDENAGGRMIVYDILNGNIEKVIERTGRKDMTAIFCIAQPNISYCYEHYDEAYQINVVKAKELTGILCRNGFHVIFFSTDNVFDGREGNYTEESRTHGVNQYGRMKAEMEQYLLEHEPKACIFRISKVVSTEPVRQNILSEWDRLNDAGEARCIRGNRLSFVAMEDVYQACVISAQRKMYGLYNIVGDRDFSRAEFAKLFFKKAGKPSVSVTECDVEAFGFKDFRPLNISMSNQKFKRETGHHFRAMDGVVDDYIKNSRQC